jgi:H/ACA ribonucleoprotein complex subunit 4
MKEYTVNELLKGCFVPIDKPRGPPSAQVGQWVREILCVQKNGHIGTLDPNVSGVLLIGINKAIRLSQYLSGQDKEYIGIMHLHREIDERRIREVAAGFEGRITQKPPLRSAVAKRWRERTIREIEVLEIDGRDVMMRVECEAGTYIRKLMFDMGKKLGCGANMLELRRIRSGLVGEEHIVSLYDLQAAVKKWKEDGDEVQLKKMLIAPEEIIDLDDIIVKESALPSLAYGSPIYRRGLVVESDEKLPGRGESVLVYSENGRFCGVAQVEDGPEMYAKLHVNWLEAKDFTKKWGDKKDLV